MKIPLVDLKANYLSIKSEIDTAIQSVIDRTAFVGGPELKSFENNWAEKCNAKYCAGLANGTSSLEVILRALNIGLGDEVICPSHTFAATAEAILMVGAKPIFAEALDNTALIDPGSVAKLINENTKAVIIVDLYGQPADYYAIKKIVEDKNITVIQDAAQSHLGKYKGRTVGSYADVTSFSFYPGKNLGAFGDAGAIVTNNEELFKVMKMISDHGRTSKYEHQIPGGNLRMDNLQAAILDVKQKYLPDWTVARRNAIKKYRERLSDYVRFIEEDKDNEAVYHLAVIRTEKRDELLKFLNDNGVGAGIHYPIPLHLQPVFEYLGYKKGDFPITEKIASEIISLPMFPEITDEQINYICEKVIAFFK
ncbi:MAG: DegT/DnrJ/EryC1/StrS family aminotransferase [Candidatus Delongbacteria bacterium]|jgi:dTDP-4-amino-4,6-dideoxygalactose transaminase|nr:DegT/DnrJ/EryC1/StrS family aminotransferase [Candidatus Delongbacteria bacterium]